MDSTPGSLSLRGVPGPPARTLPSPRPLCASASSSPRGPWGSQHPLPSPAGATPWQPAPIPGRFPAPQPRASSQLREPPLVRGPRKVLPGPRRPLLSSPTPPPLSQSPPRRGLSAGSGLQRDRGLGDTCFFRAFVGRFPRRAAQPFRGAGAFLTWPGGRRPLVPARSSGSSGLAPAPSPVQWFICFCLIFSPFGVCGGMFLLVKCKELL